MIRLPFFERAREAATAAQRVAEAEKRATIARKRLNLAADELEATSVDLQTIAETSTDPNAAELAGTRRENVRGTLSNIGRFSEN